MSNRCGILYVTGVMYSSWYRLSLREGLPSTSSSPLIVGCGFGVVVFWAVPEWNLWEGA